jgi:alkyl sulfatase BDS1-like metallo-beta-lactamase superfamily hydrolase
VLLSEDTEFDIGGVRFEVFLTGGEAASEVGLYLPEHRTAAIADEVYISMPNLYTLRGAKFRDAIRWGGASARVLELDVDVLLGCHTPPIIGRERIEHVLTTYQDAIRYNHDQAVRHVLKGATPEELRTGLVELPDFLDIDPYTRQMYGDVRNNAAQQFTGYLGWFTGDTTTIAPTPRIERDQRLVALAGGRDNVLAAAEQALVDDDPQWAAELAAMLVSVDVDDMQARNLQAAGLRSLGYREVNALRRNWYLTGALELEGKLDVPAMSAMAAGTFAAAGNIKSQLENLRYRVDPNAAQDREVRVAVIDDATSDEATAHLRNSTLRVSGGADSRADATVHVSTANLAAVATGSRTWDDLVDHGDVSINGDANAAKVLFDALDLTPPVVYLHLPSAPTQ